MYSQTEMKIKNLNQFGYRDKTVYQNGPCFRRNVLSR
jgi:hypothetical protein